MGFERTELGSELKAALERGEKATVHRSVSALKSMVLDPGVDADTLREAVDMLQSHRWFDQVTRLTEAALASGDEVAWETRRCYAQALIEQELLSAAECVISSSLANLGDDDRDVAETFRAMLGRVYKQRHVDFGKRTDLRSALTAYAEAYDDGDSADPIWTGGNLLALTARAERLKIKVRDAPRIDDLAEELLQSIGANAHLRSVWESATLIEIRLAQDDIDAAVEVAGAIGSSNLVTPFELGSLSRQLAEVWDLPPDHPVLLALGASQLELGGELELIVPEAAVLEKLLGDERPVELATYLRGLEVSRFVCKIATRDRYPLGTGFVIRGELLGEQFGDEMVILTNAHVVSEAATGDAISPQHAVAIFEALGGLVVEDLRQIWTSPVDELDVTVLGFGNPQEPDEPDPFGDASMINASEIAPLLETQDDPYVYVVGHPGGRTLSLSIRGNGVIDLNDTRIHYRAPTEPGSSGGPVFDRAWNLLAVHRAGSDHMVKLDDSGGHYPANEGIRFDAIRDAIADAEPVIILDPAPAGVRS